MIVYGNNNHVYGFLKNSAICYFGYENAHNLTVTSDGNGTLVASVYTGNVGDTAQLTYTPNTHYGFSAYSLDGGGSIAGNTYTFGTTDGTAKAWFSAWPVRSVTVTQQTGGTVAASPTTGYDGDTVTLSNTANAEYTFGSYAVTGATLTSNKFNFDGSDVTAKGSFTQKTYTLTLQTDGHGKLVANKTTGHKNDTITLTPTYSSYYRFNNYSVTGGSVNGNTFTITANATAKANFKANAFTATGTFAALNLTAADKTTSKTGSCNSVLKAFTGSKPSNWPATNSTWNVSNANSYGVKANTTWTLGRNGSVVCTGIAQVKCGGTVKKSASGTLTGTTGAGGTSKSITCNMSVVSTQGALTLAATAKKTGNSYTTTMKLGTNSWTATGYAP
jgi:hypothetical protein